jgi:hypothetical protein
MTQVLADNMRDALKRRKGIEEIKMSGGYCWMLKGNMLCGVEVGRGLIAKRRGNAQQHLMSSLHKRKSA